SDAYFTYERRDSGDQFRYAKPLYLTRSCALCHAIGDDGRLTQIGGGGAPPTTNTAKPQAAAPTTRPRPERLVGIVSVDTPSRIEANELLLNRVFILAA